VCVACLGAGVAARRRSLLTSRTWTATQRQPRVTSTTLTSSLTCATVAALGVPSSPAAAAAATATHEARDDCAAADVANVTVHWASALGPRDSAVSQDTADSHVNPVEGPSDDADRSTAATAFTDHSATNSVGDPPRPNDVKPLNRDDSIRDSPVPD